MYPLRTTSKLGVGLILGPMLRHVSETSATIWVETKTRCTVEVLGRAVPTFCVAGHHYALVIIEGLSPATSLEYDVKRWRPAMPTSIIC